MNKVELTRMNTDIIFRNYKDEDFSLVSSWWDYYNEPAPTKGMLPKDSTFILEYKKTPLFCISVYYTNSEDVCYIENFVSSPETRNSLNKHSLSQLCMEYAQNKAKLKGYKYASIISYREKLKTRYINMGFKKTLDNVSTFVKEMR